MQKKIRSFTDLEVWKKSHNLVLLIYTLTAKFPKEEIYGIINQLRRAGVSLTSNIAEGFSRFSYKEKTQFYYIALGSLTEIQNQLLIARDLNFLPKEDFKKLADLTVEVSKMLTVLIKRSKVPRF